MTKKQLQKANIKIAIAFPIGMAIKKQISLKNVLLNNTNVLACKSNVKKSKNKV